MFHYWVTPLSFHKDIPNKPSVFHCSPIPKLTSSHFSWNNYPKPMAIHLKSFEKANLTILFHVFVLNMHLEVYCLKYIHVFLSHYYDWQITYICLFLSIWSSRKFDKWNLIQNRRNKYLVLYTTWYLFQVTKKIYFYISF